MKTLIVSCTSGLCNRMFAIYGAVRLAEKMGRELKILWVRNGNLNVELSDILNSDIPCITQEDFVHFMSKPEITTKIYNSGFWGHCECNFIQHDDPHDVVLVKPWYIPTFITDRDDTVVIPNIIAELDHLTFKPEVIRKDAKDYSQYVGIHIRYGDYSVDGNIEQTDMFANSPVEQFRRVMFAIVNQRPDTKFYVSCPMEFVKADLAQHFNMAYRIVTPNRSINGVTDAITDLLTLSKCQICIGSDVSTFTKMVGVLSNKQIIRIHQSSLYSDYGWSRPTSIQEVIDRLK